MYPAALYVHIPFCVRKCDYCDFNSYAGLGHLHDAYVRALLADLHRSAPAWAEERFETAFFGGGTPTALPAERLLEILSACVAALSVKDGAEVSVEANPSTITRAGLEVLRRGANRLSLGVQSLNDSELGLLGRLHSASGAVAAFRAARAAGFGNVNLDLIFGLPNQSLARWQETLWRALDLAPEHLSVYALTVEECTPLALRIASGALPAPDEGLGAAMYAWSEATLEDAGYAHYEISNWARRSPGDDPAGWPALACRHNLFYWHNARYLGLGAGAYTYDGARRYGKDLDPASYIARLERQEPVEEAGELPDRAQEMGETMMLGLRLVRGVRWADFRGRFGVEMAEVYGAAIADSVAEGLLESDSEGVRLTARGRLLGNQVFARFLP